jgi:hypothetical protein
MVATVKQAAMRLRAAFRREAVSLKKKNNHDTWNVETPF